MRSNYDKMNDLSDGEKNVLHLICEGYTNRQIMSRLAITGRTVGSYIARIRQKLVPVDEDWTRDELIEYVLKYKILGKEQDD